MFKPSKLAVYDPLLAISATLFLVPAPPEWSTSTCLLWLLLELLFTRREQRWLLWPLAAICLLATRSWLKQEVLQPASIEDALLITTSLLASARMSQQRFALLMRISLSGLPIIMMFASERPWAPNPNIGTNQCAYLLGLLLTTSLASFCTERKYLTRGIAALSTILLIVLCWLTDSRGALVFPFIAVLTSSACLAKELTVKSLVQVNAFINKVFAKSYTFQRWILALCIAFGLFLLCGYVLLARPLPFDLSDWLGSQLTSDIGRLQIWSCYLKLPFEGENRFIYGFGFINQSQVCKGSVASGHLFHAHSVFIQYWAMSGLAAVIAMLLFIYPLATAWRQGFRNGHMINIMLGFSLLIYLLLQSLVDLSVLLWPVSQVFTGIALSAPYGFETTEEVNKRSC